VTEQDRGVPIVEILGCESVTGSAEATGSLLEPQRTTD